MGGSVIKPGMLTTVQDLGRFGFQKYGMITSGAMDKLAFRLGNLLLGNEENTPALECTSIGPRLLFQEQQLICVTGADLSPAIDQRPIPIWKPVVVPAGAQLTFGRPKKGWRSYLCFYGGLDVPKVLGSASTYLRGAIGGWEGRALQKGDQLSFCAAWPQENSSLTWRMASSCYPDLDNNVIRVIAGPHHPLFDSDSQQRFTADVFTISSNSDRMGYRLESANLYLREKKELLSSATTFGTIQVPPDGQPIVLMADHPTTGGYPIIAQVATVDLPLMAQLPPGAKIQFAWITVKEAQSLWRDQEDELHKLKLSLALKYGE